jgi:hypothetical protein
MTIESFADLVRQMRKAQSNYFRNRTTETLDDAKALERKVDDAIKVIFPDPSKPNLFE